MTAPNCHSNWRDVLKSLASELRNVRGAQLKEAKAEMVALLDEVTERTRQEGSDPLIEAVELAGHRAVQGRHSADQIHRLLSGLTAKLRVEVDEFAGSSISASALGEWGLRGRKYPFVVRVTETAGRITQGNVEVGGLGFTSNAPLTQGKFENAQEAACWSKGSDVADMPAADVTRVVVAGLEVLARKRAKGIADIDVLKIAFDVMKTESGVTNGAGPRKRLTTKQPKTFADCLLPEDTVNDAPKGKRPASQKLASTAEDPGENALAHELAQKGFKSPVRIGNELHDDSPDDEPEDDDDEAEDDEEHDDKDAERDAESDADQDAKQEADETDADADAEESKKEIDNDDDEAPAGFLPTKDTQDCDDGEADGDVRDAPGDEDEEGGTEFVGEQVLAAFKAKIANGTALTSADILQLFNPSCLAEDEDMIPMNISSLGDEFTSCDIKATVVALVKKHGALKAAELLVETVHADEEESEEEEDVEEDACEQDDEQGAAVSAGKSDIGPALKKTKKS